MIKRIQIEELVQEARKSYKDSREYSRDMTHDQTTRDFFRGRASAWELIMVKLQTILDKEEVGGVP